MRICQNENDALNTKSLIIFAPDCRFNGVLLGFFNDLIKRLKILYNHNTHGYNCYKYSGFFAFKFAPQIVIPKGQSVAPPLSLPCQLPFINSVLKLLFRFLHVSSDLYYISGIRTSVIRSMVIRPSEN